MAIKTDWIIIKIPIIIGWFELIIIKNEVKNVKKIIFFSPISIMIIIIMNKF